MERNYTGIWVNDEFKVSDKLTLTLGMRWDYQSAPTEVDDQYSTFSPTTPNPGAGGIPWRDHLCRRRAGPGGHAHMGGRAEGCVGPPRGVRLPGD